MEAFLARQPIFDTKKRLFAYELLFRDGLSNYVPQQIDGDVATTKLLSSGLLTMGVDRVTGGRKAFINFTQNLLLKEIPFLFPKETTVVEVLEDVEPTPDIIQVCKNIRAKGYTIALDDFVFKDDLKPLIDLAHIIKIDFRLTPVDEIKKYLKMIPLNNIKLLAEKIETNEEFKQAVDMGFTYFQGYFFCKPQIISGREIPTPTLNMMRIIAEINQPQFDISKVEKIITQDISLSYKLFRYINSAYFSRGCDIKSIKQAILLIGEKELKRFVSLIAIAKVAENKPPELVKASCVRARFCELLGKISNQTHEDLFILGMFSSIDAILDQPMEKILSQLPLSKDIKDALGGGTGEIAEFLKFALKFEECDWDYIRNASANIHIAEDKVPDMYAEACEWSNNLEFTK